MIEGIDLTDLLFWKEGFPVAVDLVGVPLVLGVVRSPALVSETVGMLVPDELHCGA